jgi:hypothetical protein
MTLFQTVFSLSLCYCTCRIPALIFLILYIYSLLCGKTININIINIKTQGVLRGVEDRGSRSGILGLFRYSDIQNIFQVPVSIECGVVIVRRSVYLYIDIIYIRYIYCKRENL